MLVNTISSAALALILAVTAQAGPHNKNGLEIYEDFIAAKAAATKCAAPNPNGALIYADKLKRVAGRTEGLILSQNPTLTRAVVETKLASAASHVRLAVYGEITAKTCMSSRIVPLLDFYKRQTMHSW
jgi:hypothetical protein